MLSWRGLYFDLSHGGIMTVEVGGQVYTVHRRFDEEARLAPDQLGAMEEFAEMEMRRWG